HNMAEALNRVNGVVLNPGEEFSFNGTVGDSTYDGSGFLPAGGLMNGVLIPMYGGGICQVSSTIYGAALRAGMKITLRECHSSPSSYVPIGLDATVSYDDLDFRFENSLAYPAYIVGYMDDVTLVVTIYGCQPDDWDEIEVSSWEDGTIPIPEGIQFLTDENMAKGQYELKTSGNIGYHAGAQRTYYKDGEVVRTEELPYSIYNATEKTYMVGPGTDTDEIH
ncbi:MAG: VanW family protein, partial [Oscillospiraceae bacterium]